MSRTPVLGAVQLPPRPADGIGLTCALAQVPGGFAPFISLTDGWHVFGALTSFSRVDSASFQQAC